MSAELELDFEHTVRLLLGRKAEYSAGDVHNDRLRKKWLEKVFRVVAKRLDEVDTTTDHKKALLGSIEACRSALRASATSPWSLTYSLLWLLGTVMGFRYGHGARCHSLVYTRNADQYYTSVFFEGGGDQRYRDLKNAEALRAEIAADLASRDHDTFRISLVLNTTEHRVKELIKAHRGRAIQSSRGDAPHP